MVGNLTESEIEAVLAKEVVGRIGCALDDRIYVVPISYAYSENIIYAHTYEGLKIQAMRKNPLVCFEVDNLRDISNWQSVIAWGRFEECTQREQRQHGLRLLLNRPLAFVSSITTHLGKSWPFHADDLEKIDGIVFRIILTEKSGKFENTTISPKITG